jgi:hypothetical protein
VAETVRSAAPRLLEWGQDATTGIMTRGTTLLFMLVGCKVYAPAGRIAKI